MKNVGVIEGFFGPQWPEAARLSYASFLREQGGDFYIYAPKQDPFLRKRWREEWDSHYIDHLKKHISIFHGEGIRFGVGFSPFGLGTILTDEDQGLLANKAETLNELGVDLLGLFFDDMPVHPDLALSQIEALKVVQAGFKKQIIFCPSYYTPDPILDKVFGQRPPDYLNQIADGVPLNVSLAWTGPKVISSELPAEHLRETTLILKRPPFIWENVFANDGPRNCKFLKIKPFTGRNKEAVSLVEAFGFNMMNQPELSKLLYLSSLYVLRDCRDPENALKDAGKKLLTEPFYDFLFSHADEFLNVGLDKMTAETKESLAREAVTFPDPAAVEVRDWLLGIYNVGSECLTD